VTRPPAATGLLNRIGADRLYRRRLSSALKRAVDGNGAVPTLDLRRHRQETLAALRRLTFEMRRDTASRLRFAGRMLAQDSGAAVFDALADNDPKIRRAAAEVCGLLALEVAVPSLGVLLFDRDRDVRLAGTWALGRIGGHRASDFLVRALRSRRLPIYRLVVSLAQAAPNLYLESALSDPEERDNRPWLVIALGLRRRASTPRLLMGLLDSEDPRTRAAACRALSWLGDSRDATALLGMLADPDPSVREAATLSLRPYSLRLLPPRESEPSPWPIVAFEPRPRSADMEVGV
jgi:HEAT repeat protein